MIRTALTAAIIALPLPADAQNLQCGDAVRVAAMIPEEWMK